MKTIFTILSTAFFISVQFNSVAQNISKYVNPFIGTGGHGHTFPGPTLPFGACQVSPDTRLTGWDGCSGYHYSDSIIYGFSHTHLSGTGCSDYGDILLMPTTKEVQMKEYDYASKFSHFFESAGAGKYHVQLDTWNIGVNLTCTKRVGIHEYIFPKNQNQYVVLDLKHRDEVLGSKLEIVNDSTVQGYRYSKAWATNQKVYFYIQFSKPFTEKRYGNDVETKSNTAPFNLEKQLHILFMFEKSNSPLMVKVGISGVDEDGARKNLEMEAPHWNFKQYEINAEKEWDQELGKIKVDHLAKNIVATSKETESSVNSLTTFYTALYHTMIHPSIYNDIDGRYRGRDDKIHNTEGKFDYYTVFSLWDTYRSLHPLLTIIDKKRTNDFINTFIKQYEQNGRLPIWELSSNETNCMIAYHVVSVIWDAYNKGIRNYDVELAYKAMTSIATHYTDYEKSSTANSNLVLKQEARAKSADADALESYCRYGYVRSDDAHESVSKTLEYAYDDWCIAQMAKALNKKEDYEYYFNRSKNWMNVYDPTTGFMRARKNGALYEPFSPYTVDNNYTEANSWQYSFYIPHDMNRYASLFGNSANFSQHLDALFSAKQKTEGREQADITGLIGQYAHGNEPSHQIAYMYNYTDQPNKTAIKTNYILNNFYINEPDGLIGNEDCGQMSAWYVLTAIGLYPLCPGNNQYEITEPLFDQVSILSKIHLKKDKMINSSVNQSYTINAKRRISHTELLDARVKIFKPVKTILKPIQTASLPSIQTVPFIKNGKRIFKDSLQVEILSTNSNSIYYKLNSDLIEKKYSNPIIIKDNTAIQFYTKNKLNQPNQIQYSNFTKLPSDRKVILKSTFNNSYSAGGAEAMIDGIYGKLNWRAGDWQGYQGQDVETIISFEKSKKLKFIAANFLEDQNSWIFYPKEVSFYTSNDSISWTLLETIQTKKPDHSVKVTIEKFKTAETNIPWSKYIKVIAANFGPMPQWHEGRGNETFVFIDEIEVE